MTAVINELALRLAAAQSEAGGRLTKDECAEVAKVVLHGLGKRQVPIDADLQKELFCLVREIRSARDEIAAIRPDEIAGRHIPRATDELDAILAATEDATHRIMNAAELVEGVAAEVAPEIGAKLTEAVTNIYEACGFQDITGQRVGKVVTTLRHIEERVKHLLEVVGHPAPEPEAWTGPIAAKADEDGALLHGPQLKGEGHSQDEIDALLNGTK